MTDLETTTEHWYVLRSKPHKERLLWHHVLSLDLEVYYPRIRVQPVNPRSRKVRPYFPGYMFVRVDLSQVGASTFNYMPYAIGLVSFGGHAAYVRDQIVQDMQQRIKEASEAEASPADQFKQGDKVRVMQGPLEGYEAVFDTRLSGQQRVRVLLEILGGRVLPTQINPRHLENLRQIGTS